MTETPDEILSTPEERADLRAHNARQFAALDDWTQGRLRNLAELLAEIKDGTYGRHADGDVTRASQLGALRVRAEAVLSCFALDEEPGR